MARCNAKPSYTARPPRPTTSVGTRRHQPPTHPPACCRSLLRKDFFFTCGCERCLYEEEHGSQQRFSHHAASGAGHGAAADGAGPGGAGARRGAAKHKAGESRAVPRRGGRPATGSSKAAGAREPRRQKG